MQRGGREVGGGGEGCVLCQHLIPRWQRGEERCTFSTYLPRPNLQIAAEHTSQCPAAQGWRPLEPQGSSRIAWLSVGAHRSSCFRQRVPWQRPLG